MLALLSGDRAGGYDASLNLRGNPKDSHKTTAILVEKLYIPENRRSNPLTVSGDSAGTKKAPQPSFDPNDAVLTTNKKINWVGQDLKSALHKLSSRQLWQYWNDLVARSEFQQIPIVGALLAERLRKQPDPDIYQAITDLIVQPTVTIEARALLLDLLGEIATPESLRQLIFLAEQGVDSPLYLLILQAISHIGDNRWDGKFHEELSPILEAVWSNPRFGDPTFLNAVGTALAEVGAPSGVDKLLHTLSGNNGDIDADDINRIKQEVAFQVTPNVSNPNAIDVLSDRLNQESLGTAAFEASGNALSGMDSSQATQKIVDWAQQAPDEAARNLEQWLPKISDPQSLKLIASAPGLAFDNPAIKAVIVTAADNIAASQAVSITAH